MSILKKKVRQSLQVKTEDIVAKIEPKLEEECPLELQSGLSSSSPSPSQVSTYASERRGGSSKQTSDETEGSKKSKNSKEPKVKFEVKSEEPKTKKPRRKIPGGHITPEKIRCAKNIAKNYGRAISNFAVSDIARPYLDPILSSERIEIKAFLDFIKSTKTSIKGIDTFRALLLIKDDEDDHVVRCKQAYRKIGEVFIKYFSVNWIFSSKIIHKLTYLKFRFKILRRIHNPELFTYLKG